jgi:hypothetical protein
MRKIALLGGALAVALIAGAEYGAGEAGAGRDRRDRRGGDRLWLPLVMNYGVFYEYFVDKSGPQFKAEPNHLYNTARVYTPQDTAILTPNSDTPYSFVAMDLRAEQLSSAILRLRNLDISPCSSSTCTLSILGTLAAARPAMTRPVR